jgi:hypothetical protein
LLRAGWGKCRKSANEKGLRIWGLCFESWARRVDECLGVRGGGYPCRTRDVEAATVERTVAGKRTWLTSGDG